MYAPVFSENPPVLSPKLFRWRIPIPWSKVRKTFAIGVPVGAFKVRLDAVGFPTSSQIST